LYGAQHSRRKNNGVPEINLSVALVSVDSNASFEVYLKNDFQVFMKGNYYERYSKQVWRSEAQYAAKPATEPDQSAEAR